MGEKEGGGGNTCLFKLSSVFFLLPAFPYNIRVQCHTNNTTMTNNFRVQSFMMSYLNSGMGFCDML